MTDRILVGKMTLYECLVDYHYSRRVFRILRGEITPSQKIETQRLKILRTDHV